MSEMRHERPGVYSVYDASSVTSAGRAAKRIGVAALAVKGTANTAVTLTGYGAGVEAFGEDGAAGVAVVSTGAEHGAPPANESDGVEAAFKSLNPELNL